MDRYADNGVISGLLTGTSTWAVVGLSTNTSRAAYGVSALLARLGYRIVPVHPRAETVHGQPGYRTLAEIPFPVDVVDMFVNSGRVGAVVDDAIKGRREGGLAAARRHRRGRRGAGRRPRA